MSPLVIGGIAFGVVLLLLLIGLPVAFTLAAVGFFGMWLTIGQDKAFFYMGMLPYSEMANYFFTLLPLFMIMGYFFYYANFASDIYVAAKKWVGNFRGGLAIATTLGGAGFGAACGSSTAAAAVLAKMAVPEMEKRGYAASLSCGSVAACANLATMIPPSTLMVIFGVITGQSIGQLLIAGILPGILLTIVFIITIRIWVQLRPDAGPGANETVSWKEKFLILRNSWSVLVMAAIIMGGIYSGLFTPTEAGGAGALGAFLLAIGTRRLSKKDFRSSLLETGRACSMVFFIIVGAMIFARFLAASGVTSEISRVLTGLPVPPVVVFVAVTAVYLFLGMFLDAGSILILTLPIFYPTLTQLGYDGLWFGVMAVLLCEIGLITPPVGINCFVVKGVAPHIPLQTIFRGIAPFFAGNMVVWGILLVFPHIATILPSLMKAS